MSDNKERLMILVVDDETRDRKSLCHVLTQEGHVVLEAADYWEAVQVHRQHEGEINLLVTAIALPGTNGYELAKTLFRIDPNLKVLFISCPTGAEVSRFYNMPTSGAHLLAKPVQPEDLLKRIENSFRSGNTPPYAKGAS